MLTDKKVYVVYTVCQPSAVEVVVGVFSDEQQAIDYCDHVDPKEMSLQVEGCVIDKLVEPEDRRVF